LPWLIFSVLLVAGVGYLCWITFRSGSDASSWLSWDRERWAKLLMGPEQFVCYVCFLWGCFLFASRFFEVRRQRGAFKLGLLPTEDGARILPEDSRSLQRQVDQATARHGPYILANMIRAGLAKLGLSRSSEDVRETVKTQAEVDLGRLISSMATMNYLAWAIPAVGFFGTVRGLAGSMTLAGQGGDQLRIATQHLTIAFDCTLVALALSLVAMFFIHTLQREEESLVIDCQQYCLEHLVNRIYEPEVGGNLNQELPPGGMIAGSLTERAS
jgi:biopolymer transport protein ExbB/TolQ